MADKNKDIKNTTHENHTQGEDTTIFKAEVENPAQENDTTNDSENVEQFTEKSPFPDIMPVLAVRDVVVFNFIILPLFFV